MSAYRFTQAPIFNPVSFSNCALWLDATDRSTVSVSGSNVTQWRDKSGNGNNTTSIASATYASSGLNGLPCLSNITDATGPIANPGSANISIFVVGSVPSVNGLYYNAFALNNSVKATAYANFYAAGNMFTSYYGSQNPPIIYGFMGAGNMSLSYVGAFGQPMIWEGLQNGATTFTYGNGTDYGTTNVQNATYTYNAYWLGGPSTVPLWPGYLGEIIVYNRTISTTERQQIEGYLAWKWGTATGLPISHPYKQAAPFGVQLNSVASFANTPVFNPTAVSGCQLWLDAADQRTIVLSGSNVPQWNDKSGNGRNATQGTSGQQPTYASNSVTFNKANSNVLALPNNTVPSGNSAYSMYFVMTPRSSGVDVFLFSGNAVTNEANGVYYASGVFQNYWFNVDITGGSFANGTRVLIEFVYSQNVSRSIYQNGSLQITAAAANRNSGTGNNYIGAEVLRGFYSSCDINEILLYNTTNSDTNRQQIEGYLAWKWGLVSNLPNNHPYKANPIAPFPFGIVRSIIQQKWLPTQISGLTLWLDGKDQTTLSLSGTTVTQWRDKSGLGNSTTTIVGSPTYSSASSSILLNGSSTYLVGPYVNTTTTVTAFVIATVDFSSGIYSYYYRLLSVGSTAANDYNNAAYAALIIHEPNTTNIGGYRNSQTNYVSVTTNTRFLLAQQYNGTNATLYLNGTQGGQTTSSGSFNTSSYSIGRDVGNTDGLYTYWPGTISEVILYNGSLTVAQRQQVEGYLAWKWGLQGSLPANHPFRFSPPSV